MGTINAMSRVAKILCNLQQFERAAAMQQQVLLARKQLPGTDHTGIIQAVSNFANIFLCLGQLDRTAEIQQQCNDDKFWERTILILLER